VKARTGNGFFSTKELLIEEDGNTTNLNPNYFFKCFKDEFGMTPGQYMEQLYKT